MSIYQPSTFERFKELVVDKPITVDLTADQQAVILKVHYYGLNTLTVVEESLLSSLIDTLKGEIYPSKPSIYL